MISPERGGIRLPRSSPRSELGAYLKLLSSVDAEAVHGFGFEGKFFRAGSVISFKDLRPEPNFPEIPILLEFATAPGSGPPSRRRKIHIYILWRLDIDTFEWQELGRAISESWTWASDLRPLALRALAEARSRSRTIQEPNLDEVARRIASLLDYELKPLDSGDRARVVAVLHDQLASRLAG